MFNNLYRILKYLKIIVYVENVTHASYATQITTNAHILIIRICLYKV